MATTGETERDLRERPLGEVAKELTGDVSLLIRQEIELAKAEMTQKGRTAAPGLGMFGGAGIVALCADEAACPVIVLIHTPDPAFVKEASKRGVFAYITDADAMDWQSSIDIVLRRFTEYHDLEGAFGRRAVAERAKGILMERHSIDEPAAFELLREHARSTNRKLVDVASAVVDGHRLLPKQPLSSASAHGAGEEG
jgi:response regulator NasT